MKKIFLTAFIIVIVDQLLKIWVKTNMVLGQEFHIFDWFIIHFTENNGMAFGLEFGGVWGKMILTIFRIIVVVAGILYIKKVVKPGFDSGVLVSIGLITGGAIGNIIDSIFYGLIFNDSFNNVASFLPQSGGYAPFLHGKVVDMFYFPLIDTHLPSFIPVLGGNHFIFFRPVFNIADAGISIGIIIILLFYRKTFN